MVSLIPITKSRSLDYEFNAYDIQKATINYIDNFKNPVSNTISLKSRKSPNYIQLEFTDFPYLGIWAKPNGDFICIEPWQGISDSVDTNQLISKKEGIVTLKQKCSYHAKYSIAIID